MRILASAHDAGGANLLIYKFIGDERVDFVLTGPAKDLASEIGLVFSESVDLSRISFYDKIFIGSNSNFQLSDRILLQASSVGIPTVGILDHWVNYKSRWVLSPQQVEVQDWRAFFGAFFYFGFRVRMKHNHYLTYLRSMYSEITQDEGTLLVILQPLRGSFEHGGACFCSSISNLLISDKTIKRVILREHATTPARACFEFLSASKNIEVTHSDLVTPLWSDLALSTLVLGLDSYALFVASKLNKKVYTIDSRRRSWFAPKYATLH